MKKLSIVIPAYNEEQFIGELLNKIESVPIEDFGFNREVIVIDDGSSDRTLEIAQTFSGVTCLQQEKNGGKGAAVQRGVQDCTGDYVLVQDADLEYDPNDYISMLKVLRDNPGASIYGSRPLGQIKTRGISSLGRHSEQSFGPWVANSVLTGWVFLLYQKWITDTLTAYKIYPIQTLKSFRIETHGFETDHEITSKLIRSGVSIIEVPISYEPRTVEQGKKIGPVDGIKAIWTFLKYRIKT